MQKFLNIQQILQQMPAILPNYCDVCGSKHGKEDLELVTQENDKIICRLACNTCGNVYMININSSVGGLAVRRAPFKADISANEMKKFSNVDEINNEEILDVFIALKEVGSIRDFDVLFSKDSD